MSSDLVMHSIDRVARALSLGHASVRSLSACSPDNRLLSDAKFTGILVRNEETKKRLREEVGDIGQILYVFSTILLDVAGTHMCLVLCIKVKV